MTAKKYMIVSLPQAKALLDAVKNGWGEEFSAERAQYARALLERIENETGADIEEIVSDLKGLNTCHACVVEGQESYCCSINAKKIGRRLNRLVERANGIKGD